MMLFINVSPRAQGLSSELVLDLFPEEVQRLGIAFRLATMRAQDAGVLPINAVHTEDAR